MAVKIPVYLYKSDLKANWKGPEAAYAENLIRVVQGEAGSVILNFHLSVGRSETLDLTGKTVTFYFTKPDGQKIYSPADVPVDTAAQGIVNVTLTAQSTAACGLTKYGEIRVTGSGGDVLKLEVPPLYIAASNTEGAVESTSEFHALDLALSQIQPDLTSMDQALNAMQSTLAQISGSADTAKNGAAAAVQKAQEAADSQTNAAQSETSAKSSADLAQQSAQGASSSAAAASSAALTEIGKQKGQSGGLAALDSNGKVSQRMNYSNLDSLPTSFPPQSHTHSYSDLTGASPFRPIKRISVTSMTQVASEGNYLIWGTDTSGTPTNTNCWVVDAKQEGWGMIAIAFGLWDLSIYIINRSTSDSGKTFTWNNWKKIF